MSDSSSLQQLLNGRWAGILGQLPCELHFGLAGLANPKFQGQIVIKKNQSLEIVKLTNISFFDQFGNGYLSFYLHQTQVHAMISKKKFIMQGHRKIIEKLPKHNHIITSSTQTQQGHCHSLRTATLTESQQYYPEAIIRLNVLFFAEKMN